MTARYDGHAVLVQNGRRFAVLCSISADGGGTFNPADGSDAPASGAATLEIPGRVPCAVDIGSVELVEPRFGVLRVPDGR